MQAATVLLATVALSAPTAAAKKPQAGRRSPRRAAPRSQRGALHGAALRRSTAGRDPPLRPRLRGRPRRAPQPAADGQAAVRFVPPGVLRATGRADRSHTRRRRRDRSRHPDLAPLLVPPHRHLQRPPRAGRVPPQRRHGVGQDSQPRHVPRHVRGRRRRLRHGLRAADAAPGAGRGRDVPALPRSGRRRANGRPVRRHGPCATRACGATSPRTSANRRPPARSTSASASTSSSDPTGPSASASATSPSSPPPRCTRSTCKPPPASACGFSRASPSR